MAFSAFNHIYSLFAGISSALVGVEAAQSYLASKFASKVGNIRGEFDRHQKKHQNIKLEVKGYINDFMKMYGDGKVPGTFVDIDNEADSIKTQMKVFEEQLLNRFLLREPDDE